MSGLRHVCLLHDNVPSHTSELVKQFLKSEKVTILPQPPYSPDLAPCDFFLFSKLKKSSYMVALNFMSMQSFNGLYKFLYIGTFSWHEVQISVYQTQDFTAP